MRAFSCKIEYMFASDLQTQGGNRIIFSLLGETTLNFKYNIDLFGIFLSMACVLHCLLAPIFLLILPISKNVFFNENIHKVLLLLMIIICGVAFIKGVLKLISLYVGRKDKMKKMKMINNQKGQGVMEYIIITGLVGIICLSAVKNFGNTIKNRIEQIDRKITRGISFR